MLKQHLYPVKISLNINTLNFPQEFSLPKSTHLFLPGHPSHPPHKHIKKLKGDIKNIVTVYRWDNGHQQENFILRL